MGERFEVDTGLAGEIEAEFRKLVRAGVPASSDGLSFEISAEDVRKAVAEIRLYRLVGKLPRWL